MLHSLLAVRGLALNTSTHYRKVIILLRAEISLPFKLCNWSEINRIYPLNQAAT